MKSFTILYPLLAMVALTLGVWLTMCFRRGLYMKRHRITPNDMPTRVAADQKFGPAQAPNNNLMNLFELPVLFYVACLLLFELGIVDSFYIGMTWVYAFLRYGQSAVHLTYNNVAHRGLFYLASCGILFLLWARIAFYILTH